MRSGAELSPGDLRLLHDLAVVGRMMETRPPARKRVERKLGVELARALQASLTEPSRRAA